MKLLNGRLPAPRCQCRLLNRVGVFGHVDTEDSGQRHLNRDAGRSSGFVQYGSRTSHSIGKIFSSYALVSIERAAQALVTA
jgi:hypothetical protein